MVTRPLSVAGADSRRPDFVRQQGLRLEVPVRVQGMPNPGSSDPTMVFCEAARTTTIYAQGASLRMGATPVNGQKVILTHLRSKQEVICRVVPSRTPECVELEFTQPVQDFWGVSFPAERPGFRSAVEPAKAPAPEIATAANSIEAPRHRTERLGVLDPAPAPAPALAPATMAPLPERPAKPVEKPAVVAAVEQVDTALETLAETAPDWVSRAEASAQSRTEPELAEKPSAESSPAFGTLTLNPSVRKSRHKTSRVWLVASFAVFVAAGAVVATVFLQGGLVIAGPSLPAQLSAPLAPALERLRPDPAISSPNPAVATDPSQSSAVSPAESDSDTTSASPSSEAAGVAEVATEAQPPRKLPVQVATPVFNNSNLAQPTAPPAVDAPPVASAPVGMTPLMPLKGAAVPPAPKAPARVGGVAVPPKLKWSVAPSYPPMARQARIQGDVVIEASIDTSGKVSQMRVVSGPVMLQQAAMDALRRWEYEPATLNGEPVATKLNVTIQFRQ